MSPHFGIVTAEALITGLVIAFIGILSYYLYASSGGYSRGGRSQIFWGMTASMFLVGAAFAYFSEYSGINKRFCDYNYGQKSAART